MSSDDDPGVPNCNCTKTLLAVQHLRSDLEEYKTEVLIIHCVIAVVLGTLIFFVVILYVWGSKLQRLVNALDPMSKYQKVGPSVYIKRVPRETPSISSSFKTFNKITENNIYSDPDGHSIGNDETLSRNNVGTLDRNFFTRNQLDYQNPMSRLQGVEEENTLNKRKFTDPDVTEAVAKLDKVLY